jgi:hypothetical protein
VTRHRPYPRLRLTCTDFLPDGRMIAARRRLTFPDVPRSQPPIDRFQPPNLSHGAFPTCPMERFQPVPWSVPLRPVSSIISPIRHPCLLAIYAATELPLPYEDVSRHSAFRKHHPYWLRCPTVGGSGMRAHAGVDAAYEAAAVYLIIALIG